MIRGAQYHITMNMFYRRAMKIGSGVEDGSVERKVLFVNITSLER